MPPNDRLASFSPLLRDRMLRVLLVAAPGLMAAVAILTSLEPNLALSVVLNAAAGVIISSVLFVVVSMVARQIADDRVSLAQTVTEGHWRARAQLLSILHDESGLYADWYFRLRVQEEIERSRRYGLRFAVLVTKPRPPHDGVEARATPGWYIDQIRRHLRRSDLPALLRDGSLAIMLPHTTRQATLQRRLTKVLSASETRTDLACFPEDGEDFEALLEAAAPARAPHAAQTPEPALSPAADPAST